MAMEKIKVKRLYPIHSRSLSENESTPSATPFLVKGRSGSETATFSLVETKKDGKEGMEKMTRSENDNFFSRLKLRSRRVLSVDKYENDTGNAPCLEKDCSIKRSRSGSGSMVFSAVKFKKNSKFSNAQGYPINLPSPEPIPSDVDAIPSQCSKDNEISEQEKLRRRTVSFSNKSLLHSAITRDDVVELTSLIDSEGDLDLNEPDDLGVTMMHRAAIDGSYRCLNFLLSRGADVEVTDFDGWTPLHDSVFHGHIRCVVILLISGANVEAETKDFLKPIEMAEDEEMILVVGRAMALIKSGQNPNYDKETLV